MRQITKEEAGEFYESGKWKELTDEEIVQMQLFQDRLCMPWGRFQEAVEKVLDRPVSTYEFARADMLRDEYLGKKSKPMWEDILDLFPDKMKIVMVKV